MMSTCVRRGRDHAQATLTAPCEALEGSLAEAEPGSKEGAPPPLKASQRARLWSAEELPATRLALGSGVKRAPRYKHPAVCEALLKLPVPMWETLLRAASPALPTLHAAAGDRQGRLRTRRGCWEQRTWRALPANAPVVVVELGCVSQLQGLRMAAALTWH